MWLAGSLRGEMWDGLARRMEGEIVVLEPLEARHEEGLWAASQYPEIWTRTTPVGKSREFFDSWFRSSLAETEAGSEYVLTTIDRSKCRGDRQHALSQVAPGAPRP